MAETARLESVFTLTGNESSNLSLSATKSKFLFVNISNLYRSFMVKRLSMKFHYLFGFSCFTILLLGHALAAPTVTMRAETVMTYENPELVTVDCNGLLVPWLAAAGPLAFTPDTPPEDPAVFLYNRIMADLFRNPAREAPWGSLTERLDGGSDAPDFWRVARAGQLRKVYSSLGSIQADHFSAPIAVYEFIYFGAPFYAILQGGSYQFVAVESQPYIPQGEIIIHRGIRTNSIFIHPRFPENPSPEETRILRGLYEEQFFSFTNSGLAFLEAHGDVHTNSVSHLRRTIGLRGRLIQGHTGRAVADAKAIVALSSAFTHPYSLHEYISAKKFGPSYVTVRTPLNNLRLTSYFTLEQEVHILNPNRVEVLKAHGCKVKEEVLRVFPNPR